MSEPPTTATVETDPEILRAAAHTPDSFTRTLLGEILDAMASEEGSSVDGPFQVTVTVRRLEPATDIPPGTLLHKTPGALVCIHVPFSDAHVCTFWPPIVTY